MTTSRAVLLGLALSCTTAVPMRADVPSPGTAVTVEQRAEALLGLGRVARDRGDWTTAHQRFVESDRVRPFDPALREEGLAVAAELGIAPSTVGRVIRRHGHRTLGQVRSDLVRGKAAAA